MLLIAAMRHELEHHGGFTNYGCMHGQIGFHCALTLHYIQGDVMRIRRVSEFPWKVVVLPGSEGTVILALYLCIQSKAE